MEQKEIIKKYLPLLQDLQMKVAGAKGVSMILACDGWNIHATLARPNGSIQRPYDVMDEFFNVGSSEEELNQKCIALNAFFAEAVMTTATGIDCPISLN